LHTGLGPPGYGEPIYIGPESEDFERVKKWYGPEVTSTAKDISTSAPVTGSLADAFQHLPSKALVTPLSLEFGTRPMMEVLRALRGDHWLYAVSQHKTALREEIKLQIRNAFYVDKPAWKTAVYGRAVEFVVRASRGLAGGSWRESPRESR
jgi:hypothetical protein